MTEKISYARSFGRNLCKAPDISVKEVCEKIMKEFDKEKHRLEALSGAIETAGTPGAINYFNRFKNHVRELHDEKIN